MIASSQCNNSILRNQNFSESLWLRAKPFAVTDDNEKLYLPDETSLNQVLVVSCVVPSSQVHQPTFFQVSGGTR